MKKQELYSSISLIALSILLTACGGGGGNGTPATAEEQKIQKLDQESQEADEDVAAAQGAVAAAVASGDPEAIKKAKEELEAKKEQARVVHLEQQKAEAKAAQDAAIAATAEAEKQRQELEAAKIKAEQESLEAAQKAILAANAATDEDKLLKQKIDPLVTDFNDVLTNALKAIQPIKFVETRAADLNYRVIKSKVNELDKLLKGKEPIFWFRTQISPASELQKLVNALPPKPATDALTSESDFVKKLRDEVDKKQKAYNEYNDEIKKYNNRLSKLKSLQSDYDRRKTGLEEPAENLLTDPDSIKRLEEDLIHAMTKNDMFSAQKYNVRKFAISKSLKSFNDVLKSQKTKIKVFDGDRAGVVEDLLKSIPKTPTNKIGEDSSEGIASPAPLDKITPNEWKLGSKKLDPKFSKETTIELAHDIKIPTAQTALGETIEESTNKTLFIITFMDDSQKSAKKADYIRASYNGTSYKEAPQGRILFNKLEKTPLYSDPLKIYAFNSLYKEDGTTLTVYGEALQKLLNNYLKDHPTLKLFWNDDAAAEGASALALTATTPNDPSSNVSLRQARRLNNGNVDLSAFKMNGVSGQSIELGMPLFVQLKGDVSSAKSTESATGSVAYRLGNTVIGAIQGYANSGAGFGVDSRQLETSVVASHSFGSFFVEGQIGTVSATDVHISDWSGYRSQITVGLDTEFVSPFVQVSHRQLDRSGLDLNDTTAYVGLDMEIAKLAADTYSIDTRLLAKAGYGSKNWSEGAKDLGSTTGFNGSIEWSASLNLNSGVSFGTNLALDTLSGSSAAVNVSLDR